ncbi:MAG: hypothetical protein KUG69_15290 [Marinosulfonomonas sp.]|nr:hypothetical protein [Marinosulfonomonas sp.]
MELEMVLRGHLMIGEDDGTAEHDAVISRVFDQIMDALMDADEVIDPMFSGTITTGAIEIVMSANGTDEDVFAKCSAAARTALHAAGVCTPGWENDDGGIMVSWHDKTINFADGGSDNTGELLRA